MLHRSEKVDVNYHLYVCHFLCDLTSHNAILARLISLSVRAVYCFLFIYSYYCHSPLHPERCVQGIIHTPWQRVSILLKSQVFLSGELLLGYGDHCIGVYVILINLKGHCQ